MEVECALRISNRSVEKNSLRYITMLSDCDSKAYGAVCDANVYGDKINSEKEDCIKDTKSSNNWQRQIIKLEDKKNSKLLWQIHQNLFI